MTIFSDQRVLFVLEALLGALALFAIARGEWRRRPRGGATLTVTRGPESRRKLGLVYGFASVNALQVVGASEAFKGQKVFLSLVDLLILFYLCFLNGWFKNKILGWMSKWEATGAEG